MGKFGELIATDDQPQAISAVAYLFVLALVNERMVRAAAWTNIFRGFNETVPAEVDAPIAFGGVLGDALRLFRGNTVSFFFVRQLHSKSVRLAFGREPHECFMGIAFSVVADL